MLPKLKLSYYNFFVPYEKEQLYIIYNSLSNSMIQLDWETGKRVSKLNSMEIHYLDGEVIEMLMKYGMVISSDIDEFDVVADRANANREKCDRSDTLFMVIAPTNMCNMNCPYCYQGDKSATNKDTKYLGKENMDALKKFVEDTVYKPHAEPIKKIRIEWFGGEPLVRKKTVEEFSEFIIKLADENDIDFKANIITNGSLLDAETWEMLERCRITDLQITIDGNKEMHDTMRVYLNGKGTYNKIMDNLAIMPDNKFHITIRINGDRKVFDGLSYMFDDLEERGLWPQKSNLIDFEWAPKFYNYLGYNQDKDIYYTSYDYQKSREDFSLLKLKHYNNWAEKNDKRTRKLRVAYPSFAEFYCGTVESPNSVSIDDGGYVHKCYNTINDTDMRVQHISEFDVKKEGMEHYRKFDKTKEADCRTCKVLPICEESCNMRFVSKAESKLCSAWKYFMDERMISIFEQNFSSQDEKPAPSQIVARSGSVEVC
ncbi:radical SAM protein [Aquimarina gracilis]|uniref:Radical SAM protein n=1 Tax=Aquimarina gracilis TaxID=874422 RepID=A0ABU5ZUG7_9FLAO|nr:radical SAM protein [Aquimarina gracilis]MEB3345638.1 radical SAM protein [Aquimarina gracilis]